MFQPQLLCPRWHPSRRCGALRTLELPDAVAVFNIAQSFVQTGGHRLDPYSSAQEGGEMIPSTSQGLECR